MRWGGLIAMLALGVVAWGTLSAWTEPRVRQPIQFPHKTHIELNLQCTTCHEGAEKETAAGRPATALCLSCHAGGDGSGEIKKVQVFERGGEIPWNRVWRLPPHVFFSHRIHVAIAKVECQTCHGPMETLDRPPAHPLRRLTMNDCIGCHEQRQARTAGRAERVAQASARPLSTDCASCHR